MRVTDIVGFDPLAIITGSPLGRGGFRTSAPLTRAYRTFGDSVTDAMLWEASGFHLAQADAIYDDGRARAAFEEDEIAAGFERAALNLAGRTIGSAILPCLSRWQAVTHWETFGASGL